MSQNCSPGLLTYPLASEVPIAVPFSVPQAEAFSFSPPVQSMVQMGRWIELTLLNLSVCQ